MLLSVFDIFFKKLIFVLKWCNMGSWGWGWFFLKIPPSQVWRYQLVLNSCKLSKKPLALFLKYLWKCWFYAQKELKNSSGTGVEFFNKIWPCRFWVFMMAKAVQISQKFDLLTPKIMLEIGQNYQLYISLSIIYDLVGSCKKI